MCVRHICFALILLLNGCSGRSLDLSYEVRPLNIDEQTFDISLTIYNASKGKIKLAYYLFEEYAPISDFSVRSVNGESVYFETIRESHNWSGSRFTKPFQVINNPESGDLYIRYQVQLGKKYAPHGQQPTSVYGYMNENFALASGRNFFLVPQESLNSVRIRFHLPQDWVISIPWEEEGGWYVIKTPEKALLEPKLVNSCFAFGQLAHQAKHIGGTDVSVYVLDTWTQDFKKQVFDRAFALYETVADLFGGPGGGKFVFNFTPSAKEDLQIRTFGWASSVATEMTPNTEAQWLLCAKKLIDRWIKYPPYNLNFNEEEDAWLKDGIRSYYAIWVVGKVLDMNPDPYLEEKQRYFMSNIAEQILPDVFQQPYKNENITSVLKSDNKRWRWRMIAPTLVEFLDQEIRTKTAGQYDFRDILRQMYKRRKEVDFSSALEAVVGDEIEKDLTYYLGHLSDIPQKMQIVVKNEDPLRDNIGELNPTQTDTLRILLTGNTRGFLEHCGCKLNQNGGVARRATIINQARKNHQNILLIDTGGFFPNEADQYHLSHLDIEELQLYAQTMNAMQYDVAVIGLNELFFGKKIFNKIKNHLRFPLLSSNLYKESSPITRSVVSVATGGYRIGLIGISEVENIVEEKTRALYQSRTTDLRFLDLFEVVQNHLSELKKENDFVIIIGTITPKTARKLSQKFEGIDAIISLKDKELQLQNYEEKLTLSEYADSGFRDRTLFIFGMPDVYGIDQLDLYIDRSRGLIKAGRKRIPLGDDVPDDPVVRGMIDALYSQVIDEPVKPVMGENTLFAQAQYVGVDRCKTCHVDQYIQWKTTKHATAINTLLDARRHFVPKCVVCHVTGLGYETGYQMGDLKHPLINVQCEMCHGPGGQHVQNPTGVEMLRTPSEQLCISCHDQEHSDFDFDKYYPQVRHSLTHKNQERAQ